MRLVALPQVVGEVLLDVLHKVVRVLGVQVQHLVQPLQVDALQVAVGQRFHVGVGLDHAVVQGHVRPDQVAFTCLGRKRRGSEEAGSGSRFRFCLCCR